jgi:hypothetical protein
MNDNDNHDPWRQKWEDWKDANEDAWMAALGIFVLGAISLAIVGLCLWVKTL